MGETMAAHRLGGNLAERESSDPSAPAVCRL